jgi:hypothetical protein
MCHTLEREKLAAMSLLGVAVRFVSLEVGQQQRLVSAHLAEKMHSMVLPSQAERCLCLGFRSQSHLTRSRVADEMPACSRSREDFVVDASSVLELT